MGLLSPHHDLLTFRAEPGKYWFQMSQTTQNFEVPEHPAETNTSAYPVMDISASSQWKN